MANWIIITLSVITILVLAYVLGPRPAEPAYGDKLPEVPNDLANLEGYIKDREAKHPVRKDNQARIVWHDENKQKTEYSFVYLHGYAGSYRDGYPVNETVPTTFAANVFHARWGGHGLQPAAALRNFTPESAWADAREALAIGKAIGEKVIVMSTSTGGTLALKLAAEFPEDVFALLNMSPNIEDDLPGSSLLNGPWGYQLAWLACRGDTRKIEQEEPSASQYFDTLIPARSLTNLEVLTGTTMLEETFRKVSCPVLTLYYHENILKEDERVEVDIYEDVHAAFSTPRDEKEVKPLPTPGTHWLGCAIKSKDVKAPEREMIAFCRAVLEM